ncbi:sigma-E factor negative regulatory protein [Lysobacter humi (ex Lee et al. 2017)]
MNSHDTPRHDDETLSALFDGELGGEARLFAMRRLAHDSEWQGTTGRWQLIGDALRRRAPIAAPADFAGRVRAAVAADVAAIAQTPAASIARRDRPTRSRRIYGWAGGALAASIALAAVIGLRPGETPDRQPAVAAAPTTPGMRAPVATAVPPSPAIPRASIAASDDASSSPVEVDTAAAERASPRRSIAARPARTVVASARDRSAPTAPVASTAAVLVADASNPFRLQPADSIDAQPWPRASLTGATAGGFTARYGNGRQSADDAPSFYPFEPRLESGADAGASPTP